MMRSITFFLSFFLIILSIFSLAATDDILENHNKWDYQGNTVRHNYISDAHIHSDTVYDAKSTISFGSYTEPIVADLNSDGTNELIIFRPNEIRLYNGIPLVLADSYSNVSINVNTFAAVEDIDSDGKDEIIFSSNYSNLYSIWVTEWNGSDFINDAWYNNTEGSNGIVCQNIFGSSALECISVGISGNVSYFTSSASPVNIITMNSSAECVKGSVPTLHDYDFDNDYDLFFIWGSECKTLMQYENIGGGVFTQVRNYTTTYGINQFTLGNLDGGTAELIITDSLACSSATPTCTPSSEVSIRNPLTGVEICDVNYEDYTAYYSPYLTGLNTCYRDEGGSNCDFDNNGYNEAVMVEIYTKHNTLDLYATMVSYDASCNRILHASQTNFMKAEKGGGYASYASTSLWKKVVTARADNNNRYDIILWDGIMNKSGTKISNHTAPVDGGTPFDDKDNYILVSDLDADGNAEVIIQTNTISLTAYSYDYVNTLPSMRRISRHPINPLCPNQYVSFQVDFNDTEGDDCRAIIRCYNDRNNTNITSAYESNSIGYVTPSCTYNEVGEYVARIYIQDASHPYDLSVHYDIGIDVEDSPYCHRNGDGSTWLLGTGTTNEGDQGVVGQSDMAMTIESSWQTMGLKSKASRMIFGLILLIVILFAALGAFLSYNITPHPVVFILIGLVMTILLVAIRLFPAWIIALMLIISALAASVKAVGHFSGASNGGS